MNVNKLRFLPNVVQDTLSEIVYIDVSDRYGLLLSWAMVIVCIIEILIDTLMEN